MSQSDKTLIKILCGTKDASLQFDELRKVLHGLGFQERIKGSHHIFYKQGIEEIVNLQSKGSRAKPYQVKQFRQMILRYKWGGADDV